MTSTEDKLKERIKELTCLYNVSSFIVNSDLQNLQPTWDAIALSLKDALHYSNDASVEFKINDVIIVAGHQDGDKVYMISAIKQFNQIIGSIKVGYSKEKYDNDAFLKEEEQLLATIALEIGNLLERKQIVDNEMLVKRQMERTDRLSILGEITAGIAHELNTPLANILGFTELLKERFIDDEVASNDLNKIMTSAIFSREVVKKLMFFSCEMPQQMMFTNIIPIINDAVGLLKPNFDKKALTYQVEYANDDMQLRVDPIQITQVIFNLVINAIYFSPEKGHIQISIEAPTDKEVVLKIKDEGTGIPKAVRESIFNPFFTTKPVGEGSGLGLSVVHGIVKSHKGSITQQQNSTKGTTFTVVFPKQ